ncbi:MAG: class I SAM-dependent methyltransferase [Gemmataceae bacterium]
MLTAAVRDLHAAAPGRFQTDVRTACPALWEYNPHLTPLREGDPGVEVLDMHYPLVHQSNHRPYHFLHGYPQYLEARLGVQVPVTRFGGDLHLSDAERQGPPPGRDAGLPDRFWLVVAGGKYDFTAKWWDPARFQRVVDHFRGAIRFVQCGEAGHWHPPLEGVVNRIGRTTARELVRLVYHADGVLCGVTFAMHLAAAVPPRPGSPPVRPCVVVAGGREPTHWEAYPGHQFLSTVGTLPCCPAGGCWRSRCQLVGDGDEKDRRDLCEQPVAVTPELRIPRCMHLITAADVIRAIERYYDGGALPPAATGLDAGRDEGGAAAAVGGAGPPPARPAAVRVAFHHGLGDCVYFAHLIPLYVRRGYRVEVACTPDKAVLFRAAGATVTATDAPPHAWGYPGEGTHPGHGLFWQGSKPGNNLAAPPLPPIGDRADLWQEYCDVRVDVAPHLPADAVRTADRWLAGLPRPVILLHTRGNTGGGRKDLPADVTAELYKALLDRTDGSLVLLDWDDRVPRLASYRVRHLADLGPCPTEVLLPLVAGADLLVGVDSGPLHLARFTDTPAVGVWLPGHYPATYTLPRGRQLNVVLADATRSWNRFKRVPWRIAEHPGGRFEAAVLADLCVRLLAPPRYLAAAERGADAQLQQWVRDWCRGGGNALSGYADRHRSLDLLLQEMGRRFEAPTVVETGTVRAEEDWAGAGFFTYLMAAYLARRGGILHSVDVSAASCRFAREWTAVFGDAARMHQGDSVAFLAGFDGPIDVLYLDSLDTTEPGHAEHALRELEAALPRLHDRSLVVVDDAPWRAGAFTGKGARVVPWLLGRGWAVGYGGYQVVLWKR